MSGLHSVDQTCPPAFRYVALADAPPETDRTAPDPGVGFAPFTPNGRSPAFVGSARKKQGSCLPRPRRLRAPRASAPPWTSRKRPRLDPQDDGELSKSESATCWSILRQPEYARTSAAMLACSAGCGMFNSGFLMLLDVLGQAGHSLPVLVISGTSFLEDMVSTWSMIQASYQRDHEDLRGVATELAPQARRRFARGLMWVGGADAVTTAALVGGAVAYGAHALGPTPLMGIVAGLKAGRAYYRMREFGFWSCLKMHLDGDAAQRTQRRLNRTIHAVETGLLTLVYDAESLGLYLVALRYAQTNAQMLGFSILSLAVGGMVSCLPKVFFWGIGRKPRRCVMRGLAVA